MCTCFRETVGSQGVQVPCFQTIAIAREASRVIRARPMSAPGESVIVHSAWVRVHGGLAAVHTWVNKTLCEVGLSMQGAVALVYGTHIFVVMKQACTASAMNG